MLILARNLRKIAIKPLPQCAMPRENQVSLKYPVTGFSPPQLAIPESIIPNTASATHTADNIGKYLANYPDDTTHYAYDPENRKVIKLLDKNIDK